MSTLTYPENISGLFKKIKKFYKDDKYKSSESEKILQEEIEELIEEFIEKGILNWGDIYIKLDELEKQWKDWNPKTLEYIFKILGVKEEEDKSKIREILKNYFIEYSGFKLEGNKLRNKKLIEAFDDYSYDEELDLMHIKQFLNKDIVSKFIEESDLILSTSGWVKMITFFIQYVKKTDREDINKFYKRINKQLGDKITNEIKSFIKDRKGKSKILKMRFGDTKIKNDYLEKYTLIVEYLLSRVIDISKKCVKEKKKKFITEDDVDQAICFDDTLVHLYDDL